MIDYNKQIVIVTNGQLGVSISISFDLVKRNCLDDVINLENISQFEKRSSFIRKKTI